jgi:hypothetical protein
MTARSKIGLPGCSYDAACIAGMALSSEAASVPIPKFASLCGAVACELRNQRDTRPSFWRGWGRVSFCAAEARALPGLAPASRCAGERPQSKNDSGRQGNPCRSLHLTWAHIVVGWSIIRIWDVRWSIHHIRHVRRFRRGIQLYGGQSRPFGCACGQRGCRPRRTRFNYARGDKCPDHCSDGRNQASDGSQHPRKCSPKSDGWLFFAHGSNPSMRERNADR